VIGGNPWGHGQDGRDTRGLARLNMYFRTDGGVPKFAENLGGAPIYVGLEPGRWKVCFCSVFVMGL
jgi:hypothetical protein